jgi:hypothetical protein
LHLKEIDTHILLCGIIEASGIAIEAVDCREFNRLAWILDLSNICLLQLETHVSSLQLNSHKGVISEKDLGLESFVFSLIDDHIWSDLLVSESAVGVAHSPLTTTSADTSRCIISLEEVVPWDNHWEIVDSEETIGMLECLLVLQVIFNKHEKRGLIEGADLC